MNFANLSLCHLNHLFQIHPSFFFFNMMKISQIVNFMVNGMIISSFFFCFFFLLIFFLTLLLLLPSLFCSSSLHSSTLYRYSSSNPFSPFITLLLPPPPTLLFSINWLLFPLHLALPQSMCLKKINILSFFTILCIASITIQ